MGFLVKDPKKKKIQSNNPVKSKKEKEKEKYFGLQI
jgi:hypothetical protein